MITQPKISDLLEIARELRLSASVGDFKGVTKSLRVKLNNYTEAFDIFFDHGGETLTYIAQVQFPYAGFATTAGVWNNHEVIAPLVPMLDGYALKFDLNVSHGATKEMLRKTTTLFCQAFEKLIDHKNNPHKEIWN